LGSQHREVGRRSVARGRHCSKQSHGGGRTAKKTGGEHGTTSIDARECLQVRVEALKTRGTTYIGKLRENIKELPRKKARTKKGSTQVLGQDEMAKGRIKEKNLAQLAERWQDNCCTPWEKRKREQ